jgi:3'(2'), 5'-bisphosphate nucleotidase
MSELEKLAHDLLPLVETAGHALCCLYKTEVQIITKPDGSPVTIADQTSHDILEEGLKKLLPEVQVISEEGDIHIPHGDTFWLVDPLDGTKGFLRHTGEFCINIALVHEKQPILGCIHNPLTNETCFGYGQTQGFWIDEAGQKHPLRQSNDVPNGKYRALVGHYSRNSDDRQNLFLQQFPLASIRQMGSAIKFNTLAKGEADLYLRLQQSYEWDTAAGQAIIEACGGHVLNLDKTPLTYGKDNLLNSSFVVICDDNFNWS